MRRSLAWKPAHCWRLAIPLAGLIALAMPGCSKKTTAPAGPDLTFADFQAAAVVIGQPDLAEGKPNAGTTTHAAGLSDPFGTSNSFDPFFIVDQGNHRVLGFNALPSANGVAADFVLGQADLTSNAPGGGPFGLSAPVDAHVALGKLFVVDNDNERVLIWNTVPTANSPADVVVGQAAFNTNAPATSQTGLSGPTRVVAAGGKLFVLDFGNRRLLIWNQIPTVNGAPADVVVGQPDFTSIAGGLSGARFGSPRGFWTDGVRLAIADGDNRRVLIWNAIPTTNGASADLVIGAAGLNQQGGAGTGAGTVVTPNGLWSDGESLFIADGSAHRVLGLLFPSASGASATTVLGQSNFTRAAGNDPNQDGVSEGVVSARTFGTTPFSPSGVKIIGRRLVVCDQGNHRVLIFNAK